VGEQKLKSGQKRESLESYEFSRKVALECIFLKHGFVHPNKGLLELKPTRTKPNRNYYANSN
jgi:hypothetical protein